jgi:hypothetical protein
MPSPCAWTVYVHIARVLLLCLHGPSLRLVFALRGTGDPAQLGLLGRGLVGSLRLCFESIKRR